MIEVGYARKLLGKETYFAINYSESYDQHGAFFKSRFIKMSSNWQLNMDIMSIIPSLVEALVDRLIVSSRSSQLSGGCNRKAWFIVHRFREGRW